MHRDHGNRRTPVILGMIAIACVVLGIWAQYAGGQLAKLIAVMLASVCILVLPIALYFARRPREIRKTGDKVFDAEIDRTLIQRGKGERQ